MSCSCGDISVQDFRVFIFLLGGWPWYVNTRGPSVTMRVYEISEKWGRTSIESRTGNPGK